MSADQQPNHGPASLAGGASSAGQQMRAFRIEGVDLDPECRELRVEGELDLATADQLRAHLADAAQEDLEVLVCLGRCDFIDSTGIAAILLARNQMEGKGRRLVICEPSRAVRRVLSVAGLNQEGFVYANTEAALAERFGHTVSRPFRTKKSPQGLPR